jgi:hypothetical protein
MLAVGCEFVAPGEFRAVEPTARGEFPFGFGRQVLTGTRREAEGRDFSSVTQQAGSGCVFEPYIMQECADPGIDPLLLLIADYASFAEAISFYGHQSGRRRVCDRKDCFHVEWALHG